MTQQQEFLKCVLFRIFQAHQYSTLSFGIKHRRELAVSLIHLLPKIKHLHMAF